MSLFTRNAVPMLGGLGFYEKLGENGHHWGSYTESKGHLMKKLYAFAALAAMLSALPAHAEVIDVSTVKCSELATMKPEEASYLFIWLHGYFGGQAGDTTIDLGAMEAVGTAIGEKCAANPELGLMTAIQQLGQ